jgi:hypothetical protein
MVRLFLGTQDDGERETKACLARKLPPPQQGAAWARRVGPPFVSHVVCQRARGRATVVQIDAGPYRYQGLQVLLAVVIGFAHVAFYVFLLVLHLFLFVMPLPTVVGITVGALEIAIGSKLSESVAVLKLWLIAVGVITTVFSIGCLLYVQTVLA